MGPESAFGMNRGACILDAFGPIVSAGIGIIHNCSSCGPSVSLAISSESERDYRFGYCMIPMPADLILQLAIY
jgi:hypothetical protein